MKIMRRVFSLLISLTFCQPVIASLILDQEHWTEDVSAWARISDGATFGRSQTFTVGLGGFLGSVDVQHTQTGEFTMARILATSDGTPIGGSNGSVVLATSSIVNKVGDVFTFDFSENFLPVSAGDVLALELFGIPNASWVGRNIPAGTGSAGYAGGDSFFFNTRFGIPDWEPGSFDQNFRTYIIPAPVSLALFVLGLALVVVQRRQYSSGFPHAASNTTTQ